MRFQCICLLELGFFEIEIEIGIEIGFFKPLNAFLE